MHDLSKLEREIKVVFRNKNLLKQALIHRSYLNENKNFFLGHNERLEFLGDAVLELVVTEYLYNNFSNPEGELTNYRSALVNREMLAKVANEVNIENYLLMSKGEKKDKWKSRQYIIANALEAVIGAIYLDHGYRKSKEFVKNFFLCKIGDIISERLYKDPKSEFQEIAQEKFGITPTYKVIKEWGPDHDKHFKVGLFLEENKISEGEGVSKQAAQRKAAENGLKKKKWGGSCSMK